MRTVLFLLLVIIWSRVGVAQNTDANISSYKYWNAQPKTIPFRLPLPPSDYQPEYIDLDHDGDPDILKSVTKNRIPVMWIDDNDNMKEGDIEGDLEDDCLLIDRNKDGRYGNIGDLVIDQVSRDKDNEAAMQLIADYPPVEKNNIWANGHYMWVLDTDRDGVFNYVDWSTFSLESWEHSGLANFFPDYSGQSMFMKVHAATNRLEDYRMNWENPFLFYDPDDDGLSEMAIRMVDSTTYFDDSTKKNTPSNHAFFWKDQLGIRIGGPG